MRFLTALIVICILTSTFLFAQKITLVPPTKKYPASDKAIEKYTNRPEWKVDVPTKNEGERIAPESIRLTMPSPFSGGWALRNSVLPVEPQSSIYRFKYADISAATTPEFPFRYLEVDWNMEGKPRGPNGSFSTPHFDFHFYTRDKTFVEHHMDCITTGKTCDAMKTGYHQMRNFLSLPPGPFVPAKYFPDNDSSIAAMGMHNLDGSFKYTVDNVNHNAVIIYGSFQGELVFLEVSLTLYAFQDAVKLARSGKRKTWPILQPRLYAYSWWPTEAALEYLPKSGAFIFEFTGFKFRRISPYNIQK